MKATIPRMQAPMTSHPFILEQLLLIEKRNIEPLYEEIGKWNTLILEGIGRFPMEMKPFYKESRLHRKENTKVVSSIGDGE